MRRHLVALASAVVIALLLPGAVAADKLIRYQDHTVDTYCEGPVDGGYAYARFYSSTLDGSAVAEVGIWLDPALPFEDPTDVSGSSDAFDATEGGGLLAVSADIAVVDPDGSDLGTGTLSATLTANGPAQEFSESGFGNHKSRTVGTSQEFSGTATFTLDAMTVELDGCFGLVSDIDAWATNPHSTVSSDAGLDMFCHWDIPGGYAELGVQSFTSDTFAFAYIESPDGALSSSGFSGSADISALDLRFDLVDPETFEASSTVASASASLTPVGSAVASSLRAATSQERLIQQALHADGSFAFDPGPTFPIDDTSCRSVSFSRHTTASQPSGPKTDGPPPANDTPDGAIALRVGSKVNTTNRNAAIDPEQPITTCPEGPFDDFGRTLWYAVRGTGGPITVDTAGSLIDTVIAAFVPDGDGLLEVACNDDTDPSQLEVSYQAAITFDTVEGVTYLIEVGGYRRFFDPEHADTGQIRLAVR